MNTYLIISEFQHILLTLVISLLIFYRFCDWRVIPLSFLTGFLIDIDHWLDQFACFGINFDLGKFFGLSYVYQCQRVIVLFHGWEFVLPIWLIGYWLGKKYKINGLAWALSVAYTGHLFLDHFSGELFQRQPLAYSFFYRLFNHFSLRSFDAIH